MTEAEWRACGDMGEMLREIQFWKISDRRYRLFACACCRDAWRLLPDESVQLLVERFESYADGKCPYSEVAELRAIEEERRGFIRPYAKDAMLVSCLELTRFAVTSSNAFAVADEVSSRIVGAICTEYEEGGGNRNSPERLALAAAMNAVQTALFRDVLGNPLRPVDFSSEWRTTTALSLAQQMYESRDFSAMPILADALQDAGCDNTDILNHCRDANQVHVRGCWVVDVVLGKS